MLQRSICLHEKTFIRFKIVIMKHLKIVIADGSGFIGSYVAEYFSNENKIVILSRQMPKPYNNAYRKTKKQVKNQNIDIVSWYAKNAGEWCKHINGADLVINLAGKSVNCRYNEKNKKEIFDSRTNSTEAIGNAIRQAIIPPKLWINAASATIYRHATDRPQDEFTGEFHDDFSVQVCKLWEKSFFEQRTPFTRKIAFRMAITLAAGGVIKPFLNLCKFGLGGMQGKGNQMFSWVHIEDVCRAIEFMWHRTEEEEGVYNISAPNPVTNKVLMQTLRKITGNNLGIPAPTWLLKVGAWLIGTETELILKSRWVLPSKITSKGFRFRYIQLQEALTDIIKQMPKSNYKLV